MTKGIIGCIALIPLGIFLIWLGIAVFLPLGLGFYSSVFMSVAFGIVALIVGIIGIGALAYFKITGKELPKLKKQE
jgi:hypothetical protein